MFTNQTEYQVKESLRKSKFAEEMMNMKRASEELDYYNNEQMPYVLAEIGRLRKDKASQKYATYYPLTNQIIDEISVMFSTGVDYELNYDNEDEKDLYNANLSTIVKESGLISVLSDINIYTNLNGDCGVLLDFDEETKIPKLRLITRDLFFVEQDDDDPTKISAVYVYLSPFENSPTRLSYSGYYTKITKEEIVEVRVNFNSGKAEEIESSRQENTLGFIPFVIFNKQTPINSIFSSIKNPLPELNSQINLEISRLNWVEEFQAFATLVLINADGVSNNYGADKVLILNDVNECPFEATSLVAFRKRFSSDFLMQINEMFLEKAGATAEHAGEEVPVSEDGENIGTLILDATCSPSNIKYPQDFVLLNDGRVKLEEMIDYFNKTFAPWKKPRTYRRIINKEYLTMAKTRDRKSVV